MKSKVIIVVGLDITKHEGGVQEALAKLGECWRVVTAHTTVDASKIPGFHRREYITTIVVEQT